MALPIIFPILMAAMSMGAGIIQGVSAVKNANAQAQITAQEAQDLDEYCKRNGTSRAEVAREGIKRVLADEKEQNA